MIMVDVVVFVGKLYCFVEIGQFVGVEFEVLEFDCVDWYDEIVVVKVVGLFVYGWFYWVLCVWCCGQFFEFGDGFQCDVGQWGWVWCDEMRVGDVE